MSETDIALYGGSLILGPLFLAAAVLFYLWHEHGPITKRGREKMLRQRQETWAYFWSKQIERETGIRRDPPEE